MNQEAHVRNCLDGGKGHSPQIAKYLVYRLPGESSLIGIECKTRSIVRISSSAHFYFFRYNLFRGVCGRLNGRALELPL